jgi:hypothetical protein
VKSCIDAVRTCHERVVSEVVPGSIVKLLMAPVLQKVFVSC